MAIPGGDDLSAIILARKGRFIVASVGTTLSFWDTMTEKQIGPVIDHGSAIFSTASHQTTTSLPPELDQPSFEASVGSSPRTIATRWMHLNQNTVIQLTDHFIV